MERGKRWGPGSGQSGITMWGRERTHTSNILCVNGSGRGDRESVIQKTWERGETGAPGGKVPGGQWEEPIARAVGKSIDVVERICRYNSE